jgi:threonine synthase
LSFAVPTGNFGNIYAGYAARAMGLPIDQFIACANVNDILPRFFESGELRAAPVMPTISPSMDIQISSNFERFLFELYGRDGAATQSALTEFRASGTLNVGENLWRKAVETFDGYRLDDAGTRTVIGDIHRANGYLLDPHSAIGVAAARARRRDSTTPIVVLATAHPAKFPDAVLAASGVFPELPPAFSDLHDRPERFDVLPNDLGQVQAYIRANVSIAGVA